MSSTPRSASSSSAGSALISPSRQSSSVSIASVLKKPFQGWSKNALWARKDLDDDYNFPHVKRRGEAGMSELNVRRA